MQSKAKGQILFYTLPSPIHQLLKPNSRQKQLQSISMFYCHQIETTKVKLTTFPDGHMSHIENEKELKQVLVEFLKKV